MDAPYRPLLGRTTDIALDFLDRLPERPVAPPVEVDSLASLDGPLPEEGEDPVALIERLARDADPGITASTGPRYFGFVTGGALPAALAADWLASAWDQVVGMYVESPALAVVERTTARWVLDLLGLPGPETTSVGFTTGCTMANFTGLAAGRHAVLRRAGWNVEADGLFGAPEIHVVAGAEAHASIFAALQMLGLGRERVTRVAADGQGRMRADDRLRPGGQREQRRVRPVRADRRGVPGAWSMAPRRRRLRAVGRGLAPLARSNSWRREGRFLGHRRAQVAQRSV